MRRTRNNRGTKTRQASKLEDIREALIAAGCDTTAKQAAVLGVCRATAWVVLNRDKRAGPSANIIKRILSSPKLPSKVRQKVEEYVEEKIGGLYGHSEPSRRAFSRSISYLGTTHGEPKRNTRSALDDRHRTKNQTLPDA